MTRTLWRALVLSLSVSSIASARDDDEYIKSLVRAAVQSGVESMDVFHFEPDDEIKEILNLLRNQGEVAKAEKRLTAHEDTLRKTQPQKLPIYFRFLAQVRMENRDFPGVVQAATECLKQKKDKHNVTELCFLMRAVAHAWLDDYRAALADAARFKSVAGSREVAAVQAWAHLNLGEWDKAAAAANRAIALQEDSATGAKGRYQNPDMYSGSSDAPFPDGQCSDFWPRIAIAVHTARREGLDAGLALWYRIAEELNAKASRTNADAGLGGARIDLARPTMSLLYAHASYLLGEVHFEAKNYKEATSGALNGLGMTSWKVEPTQGWRLRMHSLRARASVMANKCDAALESAEWLVEQRDARGKPPPEAKVGAEVLKTCRAEAGSPLALLQAVRAAAKSNDQAAVIDAASKLLAMGDRPKEERLEVLESRAVAFFKTDRRADALVDIDGLIELAPENPRWHSHRGETLVVLGRGEEAIAAFTVAIDAIRAAGEGMIDAYTALDQRSKQYYGAGRFDEALADVDTLLVFDRKNGERWQNRGEVLIALKRHAEALEPLGQALEIDPNNVLALRFRADCHEALGNAHEADVDRKRAQAIEDLAE